MSQGELVLASVSEADFESLLAIRIAAMRDSLQRLGRFDPERARQRLRASFNPMATQKIVVEDQVVGFYALRNLPGHYALDHLYLLPEWQGQGIGGQILRQLQLEHGDKPMCVGALRGSDSNRFYLRHGFVQQAESEWDIEYIYEGMSIKAN